MPSRSSIPNGIVADGAEQHAWSEEFCARERAVRLMILGEFVPRLNAARGMWGRLRVRWQMHRAQQRALRELYPSPHSLF